MAYYNQSANPQSQSPVELVKSFRAQGMDNNQIIQALQRQGFSSNVIFDAMNQVETAPLEQPPEQDNLQNYSIFQGAPEPPKSKSSYSFDNTTNEELIEAVVEEKWNNLVKDLNKIIEWKNVTSSKIAAMEQKLEDTRREIDKLQGAIIAKIDDYDKNISNVGAEVKAMEKVFSKVLPVFAENVAELSRIAKELKTPKTK